jgi:beta-galactosidase GanA
MAAPIPDDPSRFPFLFGTQYYRAPTPGPEAWDGDLRTIAALGFNAVKFFVQWRWSHRSPDRFFFDDLDRLMDLAAGNGLGVTLNFILDVAPAWLYDKHPDARPVDAAGRIVEPRAVGHRTIGGHPGPCYRHPGALADRQRFVAAAVEHFRGHPGLAMWDVWNEPELCFPQRVPDLSTMACYCPSCVHGFQDWLRVKHGDLDRLNAVWGRCYESWDQVEAPRDTGAVADFVDWREFHLDTLAEEAAWRLDAVKRLDPRHGRYLHVVPNCWFSAVTCADDFAMAEGCEVFAATMNGRPGMMRHVISAGRGRAIYNVESHLNFGSTDMHQRRLGLEDVLADLLPQLGAGVKGVLFWQYRSEILGNEAPAWGLVRPDGSARPVTDAVRRFWEVLRPHAAALRRASPTPASIGVWRSRKNEIFHFCMQGSVAAHNAGIEAYLDALYWDGLPHTLVNDRMLAHGELDGIRLLVMPGCYYLGREEADALDRWVRAGGVLLAEAHLGGYDGTTGRHSRAVPGCGLAESWGIREAESTAAVHLSRGEGAFVEGAGVSDDVRKALDGSRPEGGTFFPIRLWDGSIVLGAHRYAELEGPGLETLGSFDGVTPCLASVRVGRGTVFYCGTNLGQAAGQDASGLEAILRRAATTAGLGPGYAEPRGSVHLDLLSEAGAPRFAVMLSRGDLPGVVRIDCGGRWRGLYTGTVHDLRAPADVPIPAGFGDIFVIED